MKSLIRSSPLAKALERLGNIDKQETKDKEAA
jgi:hypothetical protein